MTYDVTGHDEYIVPGRNALVPPRDKDGVVVEYLRRLKADPPELRRSLGEGARKTASSWPDWDAASSRFHEGLQWMTEAGGVSRHELTRLSAFLMEF